MILKEFKEKYNITEYEWQKLLYKYPEINECIGFKRIRNGNLKYIFKLKKVMNILNIKNDYINMDEISAATGLAKSTLYIYYCRQELSDLKINANYVNINSLYLLKELLFNKSKKGKIDKFNIAIKGLNELL